MASKMGHKFIVHGDVWNVDGLDTRTRELAYLTLRQRKVMFNIPNLTTRGYIIVQFPGGFISFGYPYANRDLYIP